MRLITPLWQHECVVTAGKSHTFALPTDGEATLQVSPAAGATATVEITAAPAAEFEQDTTATLIDSGDETAEAGVFVPALGFGTGGETTSAAILPISCPLTGIRVTATDGAVTVYFAQED
jgi:hypothetical protein